MVRPDAALAPARDNGGFPHPSTVRSAIRIGAADAAAKSGHAHERDRRGYGTRHPDGQPRYPARRERAAWRSALAPSALGLLPARVQGSAPHGHGAGAVHRIVLSRRGDRSRRRPPPMLRVPTRGFSSVPGGVAAGVRCSIGPVCRRYRPGAPRGPHQPRTRCQVRCEAPLGALPDGAFVLLPEDPSTPLLIFGDRLLPWRPSGYGRPRPRAGARRALVLTPRPTIAVLRAGYAPALHPSAPRALG
jgi:hypothetical protein